jgi:hypothetical protein
MHLSLPPHFGSTTHNYNLAASVFPPEQIPGVKSVMQQQLEELMSDHVHMISTSTEK